MPFSLPSAPKCRILPASRGEWVRGASAVASGLLLAAAFPPFGLGFLAWVAAAPVLATSLLFPRARGAWKPFAYAFFLAEAVSLSWLSRVTVCGWLALSAVVAATYVPSGLAFLRARRAWAKPLAFALFWTAGEYFRGRDFLFGGFGWNPLAVALVDSPAAQLAEWGGVWPVSFLAAFVAAALACAAAALAAKRFRAVAGHAAAVLLLAAMACGAGAALRARAEKTPCATCSVGIVQPWIPQDDKWSGLRVRMIYERLLSGSFAAAKSGAQLLLWPEAAVPDDIKTGETSLAVAAAALEELGEGGKLLTGSLDTVEEADGEERYYNAAVLLGGGAAVEGTYAKRHLVAFGEFIPLLGWMSPRTRFRWGIPPDISAGREGQVFRAGEMAFSPLVCFEDSFGALARRDVRAGARALVNLTNDAWFDAPDEGGRPARVPWWGPQEGKAQHWANARYRAIENRVPVVRAANTGKSGVIDLTGRDAGTLPAGPGGGTFDVAVPLAAPRTLYGKTGDLAGVVCFWTALLFSAFRLRKRGKAAGTGRNG
jgi:apolipoprotein N-acyltransferase